MLSCVLEHGRKVTNRSSQKKYVLESTKTVTAMKKLMAKSTQVQQNFKAAAQIKLLTVK